MFHVGWQSSVLHISLACFGIIANALLLRDVSCAALIAYTRIIYSFTIRIVALLISARNISISIVGETGHVGVLTLIRSALPVFFVLLLYQGFYGGCVYLYSKWKKQE